MKNVDLPEKFANAKVIQLYIKNQPWLVGRVSTDANEVYHSQILEDILKSLKIKFSMNAEGVPELFARGYRVAGMGKCKKSKGTYYFSGYSASYSTDEKEFGINRNHLEDFQKINPEFKYQVK